MEMTDLQGQHDASQDETKRLKSQILEEQTAKDKAKQAAEDIVVEERQIFEEAIRIEHQYHNNKSNKEKRRHKDAKLSKEIPNLL